MKYLFSSEPSAFPLWPGNFGREEKSYMPGTCDDLIRYQMNQTISNTHFLGEYLEIKTHSRTAE
jgi:hypothetical protein